MAPTCSNCRRLRPHKKSRRENEPLSSGGAALTTVCQKGPPLHLRSGEAPYLGTTSGLLPSIAYRAIQVPDD